MAMAEHLHAHSKHRVSTGPSKALLVDFESLNANLDGTATSSTAAAGAASASTLSRASDIKKRERDVSASKPHQSHHSTVHPKGTDALERNRSTTAYCIACGSKLGEFYNSWLRITGSYHLPAQSSSYQSTGVQAKGKVKPALDGTVLGGCTIQPLGCSQCDNTVGIICIKTPENKVAYAEREFFKLPRIQLRAETSGRPVDPIIEGEQHETPQAHAVRSATLTPIDRTGDGSVTAVQAPTLPAMSVQAQRISDEHRRHDLPTARTIPSSQPSTQAQSSSQSQTQAQSQKHSQQHHQQAQQQAHLSSKSATSFRDSHQQPQTRQNERPTAQDSVANNHSQMNRPSAPITYPSALTVKLDAVDRIQTQVNLNRATLENCTRDISRLENSITGLANRVEQVVESIRVELLNTRQHAMSAAAAASAGAPSNDKLDDHALEVFSTTLSQVVTKTNDIDALKVQFELIKRKIKRLEEGSTALPVAIASGYASHARDAPTHQPLMPNHIPASQTTHVAVSSHPERAIVATLPSQQPHYSPEPSRVVIRPEHDGAAPGGSWVSVNTGLKRGPPTNGFDERLDVAGTPIGSPKRPKLAPIEPRYNYEGQPGAGPIHYERRDTDDSVQSGDHRTNSHESYPDATNASNFIPYTQDAPSDESWRPMSQRAVSGPVAANASPRGRGRGRGGRPRKSLPVQTHIMTTPDWEKDGWTGSQIETDGFYRGAGVIRRGSGGALSGSPPQTAMMDPYAHTKKSRTRPIRNSDGILIRKDGRPDMRSQSSAANLRKVHSKKEEERREGSYGAPTSGLANEAMVAESPDSTESQDYEPSGTQERAQHIMKQMFPNGVEEGINRLYTAQRHFPGERDPPETKRLQHDSGASESPAIADSAIAETPEDPLAKDSPRDQDDPMPKGKPASIENDAPVVESTTGGHTVEPNVRSVASSQTLQPALASSAVAVATDGATS